MKVVIVGGSGRGDVSRDEAARRSTDAEIIVLERSGHVSYANCGLPYFVGGVIEDEDRCCSRLPLRSSTASVLTYASTPRLSPSTPRRAPSRRAIS